MTEQSSSTTVAAQVAAERVARGLAWIKANADALDLDPGRINPDSIEINHGYLCPLAQAGARPWFTVSGEAVRLGLADREPYWTDDYASDQWSVDHGFMVMYSGAAAATDLALTVEAWRAALAAD